MKAFNFAIFSFIILIFCTPNALAQSDDHLEEFRHALENNDLEHALTLAKDKKAARYKSKETGINFLMIASYHGATEICRILIENGADINLVNSDGMTALIFAAAIAYPDIVHLLLENNADPDLETPEEENALTFAWGVAQMRINDQIHDEYYANADPDQSEEQIEKGIEKYRKDLVDRYSRIFNMLLEHGITLELPYDFTWSETFGWLPEEFQVKIIKLLLENEADTDIKDYYDNPLFLYVLDMSDTRLADKMIGMGVNINMRDFEGYTALMQVAKEGKTDLAAYLIKNGADVNAFQHSDYAYEKRTALMLTAEAGHLEMMELLIHNGAIIDKKEATGQTALMYAANSGNNEIVAFLLEKGAKIDELDKKKRSALHLAALSGSMETVRILIDHGADLYEKDESGFNVFHYAAHGDTATIKFLIDQGVDINIRDDYGFTALIHSVLGENPETAHYLLKRGIDPDVQDEDGQTALIHFIKDYGSKGMGWILLTGGCDPDIKDNEGSSARDYAESYGMSELFDAFEEYKANRDEPIQKSFFVDPRDQVNYASVKIGDQWWMAENLNTGFFRNGDPIPHASTTEEWDRASEEATPAWCYYENDPENAEKYGRLYNWYALVDSRGLAPEGWKVPSDEDWMVLELYLGMSEDELDNDDVYIEYDSPGRGAGHGRKLKSLTGWEGDDFATNSTGFSALPAGSRTEDWYSDDGWSFSGVGSIAVFWASTESGDYGAWYRELSGFHSKIDRTWRDEYSGMKGSGHSVRCIKEY